MTGLLLVNNQVTFISRLGTLMPKNQSQQGSDYNEPSSKEFKLPENLVIMSTSDLYGNIVDYNNGFKEASGYSDAELIGKPHNLLRHPDMPKAAFEDFWRTLKAGKPWRGLVKNKRKDGRHYWVMANASPIIEQGKTTGYLSVRYPASREQIQHAETLYADVRASRKKFPRTQINSQHIDLVVTLSGLLIALFAMLMLWLHSDNSMSSLFAETGLAVILPLFAFKAYQSHRALPSLKKGIERLANGKFREPIEDKTDWGCTLNMIRSRIAEGAARNYDALISAQVLSTALDSATTNIMVADSEFNIQHINNSLREMFQRNEKEIQKVLPDFKADAVAGSNMDIFHKNPQHQRTMISQLTGAWEGDLHVADLVLRLNVVPIEDDQKHRLGYVVEWLDRTQEAKLLSEISWVIDGMKSGVFDRRVTFAAEGVFGHIKEGINDAVAITQKSVDEIKSVASFLAEGDLTASSNEPFKGDLEQLQTMLNAAVCRIREVMEKTVETTNLVNMESKQVLDGALSLSERVQEQASALQQTSSTMNQISSTVANNSELAHRTATKVTDFQNDINSATEFMEKSIKAMDLIQESGQKISEIVTIIDSIAFQTNLLALNAAVEAARAGEQGRGFAVVASEVRNLAQKSADAAHEIKALIDESVVHIGEGTSLVRQSGETLHTVNEDIEEVVNQANQIALASDEQSSGIDQINKAIAELDIVTQQNAALVEETTAATETLTNESEVLTEAVSFFKT